MSTFTCEVVEANISPHPNADAIDLCNVGLFQSIVRKDLLKTGDLCIYIPEAALCPDSVMKYAFCWDEVKNRGKLSGANNNRVKAVKLRGVLSQGLIVPLSSGVRAFYNLADEECVIGNDLQEKLGVEKYVPKIPDSFFGPNQPKIAGAYHGYTPSFDVENLKKYKNSFVEGELVRITEKIHGTCCVIGAFTQEAIDRFGFDRENLYSGCLYVGTKSLTKRGIVYNPNDDSYIYSKVPKDMGILDNIAKYMTHIAGPVASVVFIGEIFGPGVQKGFSYGQTEKTFRLFEIQVSLLEDPSRFFSLQGLDSIQAIAESRCGNIPTVPVLYEGPWSEGLIGLNSGMSALDLSTIREGIVVRSDDGKKLLKYVSEAYLLRKGDVTEYE